jgi:hypothetical protein
MFIETMHRDLQNAILLVHIFSHAVASENSEFLVDARVPTTSSTSYCSKHPGHPPASRVRAPL